VTSYVAFLRGVNVGARRMAMAELRRSSEALGLGGVRTYLQSGNVVFRSPAPATTVRRDLEQRIARDFGFEVTVIVRSHRELRRVVEGNPLADGRRDPSKLHVTLLASSPRPVRVDVASAPDEFAVAGREVYLFCPDGYGRSKLTNALFERKLGVAATTRNWKTMTTLLAMAGD